MMLRKMIDDLLPEYPEDAKEWIMEGFDLMSAMMFMEEWLKIQDPSLEFRMNN